METGTLCKRPHTAIACDHELSHCLTSSHTGTQTSCVAVVPVYLRTRDGVRVNIGILCGRDYRRKQVVRLSQVRRHAQPAPIASRQKKDGIMGCHVLTYEVSWDRLHRSTASRPHRGGLHGNHHS